MNPALLAITAPPFATVQDAGRVGWMRWGVSGGGAMDQEALANANALVGNAWNEAAIEFALSGGEWEVEARSCRLAVCGGAFGVFVDDQLQSAHLSLTMRHGQRLRVQAAPDAVWGYIAVQGGLAVPEYLGSRSTHVRTGIGGLDGGTVSAGSRLPLRISEVWHAATREIAPPVRGLSAEIRVVLGPQDDHFEPASVREFTSAEWHVTNRMDRMGYHISGPLLAHSANGANIISDGIVAGSLQVPASGQPIALMMDRQTTGGYPKIATIVTADLGKLAQCRRGTRLHFHAIPVEEAVRSRRELTARLTATRDRSVPLKAAFARKRRSIREFIAMEAYA